MGSKVTKPKGPVALAKNGRSEESGKKKSMRLKALGRSAPKAPIISETAIELDGRVESLTSKVGSLTIQEGKHDDTQRTVPKAQRGFKVKVAKPVHQRPSALQNERAVSNETETESKVQAPSSVYPSKKWAPEEDKILCAAVEEFKAKNWKFIADKLPGKTHVQCLQRWNKVLKPGLVKGPWTVEEDNTLADIVKSMEATNIKWVDVAKSIPGRTAKQCRERWSLNLDPKINRSEWTAAEDQTLLDLQRNLGNKWAQISNYMNGRTENAVKTRYKSLHRKLKKAWTPEEDQIILQGVDLQNNRWMQLASRLPHRTRNAIKLRWKCLQEESRRSENGSISSGTDRSEDPRLVTMYVNGDPCANVHESLRHVSEPMLKQEPFETLLSHGGQHENSNVYFVNGNYGGIHTNCAHLPVDHTALPYSFPENTSLGNNMNNMNYQITENQKQQEPHSPPMSQHIHTEPSRYLYQEGSHLVQPLQGDQRYTHQVQVQQDETFGRNLHQVDDHCGHYQHHMGTPPSSQGMPPGVMSNLSQSPHEPHLQHPTLVSSEHRDGQGMNPALTSHVEHNLAYGYPNAPVSPDAASDDTLDSLDFDITSPEPTFGDTEGGDVHYVDPSKKMGCRVRLADRIHDTKDSRIGRQLEEPGPQFLFKDNMLMKGAPQLYPEGNFDSLAALLQD
mmetsp:Transcript_18337/g.32434  ORF Transcript_18337/g.32434 Transcript_18337/m.32434 type:complete len:675 (+) Transcript_18337:144-2168(+)